MKQRILNFLLHHFGLVTDEDVILQDKGNLILGGKPISQDEIKQLQAEIKALESMRLWKILNETLKYEAFVRGWKNSTKMEDLNAGKIIYHTLDVQNSIIKIIKNSLKTKNMV